jgi:hypothetical protein
MLEKWTTDTQQGKTDMRHARKNKSKLTPLTIILQDLAPEFAKFVLVGGAEKRVSANDVLFREAA